MIASLEKAFRPLATTKASLDRRRHGNEPGRPRRCPRVGVRPSASIVYIRICERSRRNSRFSNGQPCLANPRGTWESRTLTRDVRKLPCSFVVIECKNYTREIENPELDQLGGRFSPLRGKVGILCCRRFDDRARFVKRCKDTLADDRGLILPLDDERVLELLGILELGNRHKLDEKLTEWVNELFF
jgi:hypothetical protein